MGMGTYLTVLHKKGVYAHPFFVPIFYFLLIPTKISSSSDLTCTFLRSKIIIQTILCTEWVFLCKYIAYRTVDMSFHSHVQMVVPHEIWLFLAPYKSMGSCMVCLSIFYMMKVDECREFHHSQYTQTYH